MTKSDLDRIRARANAATPGPWEVKRYGWPLPAAHERRIEWLGPLYAMCDCEEEHAEARIVGEEADMTFMCAARTDVPALCDALEEAMRALAVASELLDTGNYYDDDAREHGQKLLRQWRGD